MSVTIQIVLVTFDSAYWGSVQLEQLELIRYDHIIERERATTWYNLLMNIHIFNSIHIF